VFKASSVKHWQIIQYISECCWKRGKNSATQSGAHRRQVSSSKHYFILIDILNEWDVTKYFEHKIYLGQKILMLPLYETCSLSALPDSTSYGDQL
jgi:hypothetical protein